jgi:curved DNA-binding protein CbpA
MTTATGYHDIHGLTPEATLVDVTKASRRLARQHHPDRHKGAGSTLHRQTRRDTWT